MQENTFKGSQENPEGQHYEQWPKPAEIDETLSHCTHSNRDDGKILGNGQTVTHLIPAIGVVDRRLIGPEVPWNECHAYVRVQTPVLVRNLAWSKLDDVGCLSEKIETAQGAIRKLPDLFVVLIAQGGRLLGQQCHCPPARRRKII